MENKNYISGGTLRVCPYSGSPQIVTFFNDDTGKTFDRSQCPHHSECTDESCPLCNHLKD